MLILLLQKMQHSNITRQGNGHVHNIVVGVVYNFGKQISRGETKFPEGSFCHNIPILRSHYIHNNTKLVYMANSIELIVITLENEQTK